METGWSVVCGLSINCLTRMGARESRKSMVILASSVNQIFSISPKLENLDNTESMENDAVRGIIIDLFDPPL